jgi:hypothetical protein
MKYFTLLLALSLGIFMGHAQQAIKIKPELKVGTVLEYEVDAQGQTLPLLLKIASIGEDGIVYDYDLQNGMVGKFVNSKLNLEKGVSLNWDQPVPGEERKLADNQTIAVLSRTFLKELKQNKKSFYDGIELLLKDVPKGSEIVAGGKEIDAVYAESTDGGTGYWILNNDAFPLLLKLSGNPGGINLAFKDIKNQ